MGETYGPLALGIVGAGLGGLMGGGAFGMAMGWAIGAGAGSLIWPPDPIKGPRLDDLTAQTSAYGRYITKAYGSLRLAGNVIWADEKKEHEHEEGKGSAPSALYYTYTCSFAIGLCDGEINGINRIWADNKLIFSYNMEGITEVEISAISVAAGSSYITIPGEVDPYKIQRGYKFIIKDSTANDGVHIARSVEHVDGNSVITVGKVLDTTVDGVVEHGRLINNPYDYIIYKKQMEIMEGITVYYGTEDQLPDPVIEAVEGVGYTPAYRGLSYIVFENFNLTNYGNRIPNIEVELSSALSGEPISMVLSAGTTAFDIFSNGYTVEAGSRPGSFHEVRSSKGDFIVDLTDVFVNPASGTVFRIADERWHPMGLIMSEYADRGYHYLSLPSLTDHTFEAIGWCGGENAHSDFFWFGWDIRDAALGYVGYSGSQGKGRVFAYVEDSVPMLRIYDYWDGELITAIDPTHPTCEPEDFIMYTPAFQSWPYDRSDGPVLLKEYTLGFGVANASMAIYGEDPDDGKIYMNTGIYGTGYIYTYTLASLELGIHADYFEITGHDTDYIKIPSFCRNKAFEGNLLVLDESYEYPDQTGNFPVLFFHDGISDDMQMQILVGDIGTIPLSEIVASICDDAGCGPYDVSELTDTLVNGYAITSLMSGKNSLEPLMRTFQFDAVEIDWEIKFIKRGKASIATIALEELAAHESGNTIPDSMVTTKIPDMELPKAIEIRYSDPALDYDFNTQVATRQNQVVSSKEVRQLDTSLVYSGTQALRTAHIILQTIWMEQIKHTCSTFGKYLWLTPADVAVVNNKEVVIGKVLYKFPNLLDLEIARSDSGVCSSTVVADPVDREEQVPPIVIESYGIILDTATLDSSVQTAPGFYAGVYSYIPTRWLGGSIFCSVDDGNSWTLKAVFDSALEIGYASEILATGPTTIIDEGNTLNIKFIDETVTLSSSVLASVLAGANTLAVGEEGRWEIISFLDAVLETDGTYTVSNLIRGRRGTDIHTASHVAKDKVIVLDADFTSLQFIEVPLAYLQVSILYKFVSFGQTIDEGIEVSFTCNGDNLKPFAPGHIEGSVGGSGELIATDITYDVGKVGQAASFNGTTSKAIIAGNPYSTYQGGFACWVKTPVATNLLYQTFFAFGGNAKASAGYFFCHFYGNGTHNSIVVEQKSDGGVHNAINTGYLFLPNTWYHIVLNSDGEIWTLYVNAVLQTVITTAGLNKGYWFADTIITGAGITCIGKLYYNGNYFFPFNGLIDQALFYEQPLSADQRTELYNAGAGIAYPGFDTSNLRSAFEFEDDCVDVHGFLLLGDWTLTWVRRSRTSSEWISNPVPLMEAYEQYEIDILDGDGAVVRTITVDDATTVIYTAAQQIEDFGILQTSISIEIYQISDVVGRGFKGEATL